MSGAVREKLAALVLDPDNAGSIAPELRGPMVIELAAILSRIAASELAETSKEPRVDESAAGKYLTPAEAAERLGVKVRWIYAHADEIPGTRHVSAKCLRISERGFEKYMARKGFDKRGT
jgi:hypothetical protein